MTALPDKERLRLTGASRNVARATWVTVLRMTASLGLGLTILGLKETIQQDPNEDSG